jgi:hypothetical protein
MATVFWERAASAGNDAPTFAGEGTKVATGKRFPTLRRAVARAKARVWPRRRLIRRSHLFDADWYCAQYPEALLSRLSPLDHYLAVGWKKGFCPGPHFEPDWYVEHHRDVAPGRMPLLHYLRRGKFEARLTIRPENLLFDRFLSIGDNCEFGLVQHHCGGRVLGLFNAGATAIDALITALDTRFAALDPDGLTIGLTADRKYYVHLGTCPVGYHTGIREGAITLEKLKAQERRRVAFLARKFLEDLEEADKILVFKSRVAADRSRIDDLVCSLRKYGPNTLLWVTEAEPGHPAGEVRQLADGLLRGYIDRFAPYETAHAFSVAAWLPICRNAHRIWSYRRRHGRQA